MNTACEDLRGKRFVVGVTGGIAAYKACEFVRLLLKAGAEVDVAMSEAATRFVTPLTFQALSGRPVAHSLWQDGSSDGMAHIQLSRNAAAIVIVPASADFLANVANGCAHDLLTALCLARSCPLLVAPAMNRAMWENRATQRNLETLRRDGVAIAGPAFGEQACGEIGAGRLLEPEELFAELVALLQPKPLAGRRVIVTAGPTYEPLDPVRGLTNRSSGKMGFALANACREAGADVTLIAGPVCLTTPYGVRRVDVLTAAQMRAAVLAHLPADIFISVAAVADYRPERSLPHKIKKGETLTLSLVANPDILAEVAALPQAPFCVGFAAESQMLDEYAEKKRKAKGLPLVVGNLIEDGLGTDVNSVILYDDRGRHPLPTADKQTLARRIVAHIAELYDHGQN
ncbi:MAG: bifunctional phosphopantothenoylcysteine decarboxylase/phosphopantothenate--cysteine ligase CoaBC [Rhodocyclaceae bacterium]|nr:bifunctional phosphopantothenoylcysteine decarboxylase/phosphopantothenate--cysteine ligase CoaBC [Rhodocyclaceae bacterium]